jgi:hypothetical protein
MQHHHPGMPAGACWFEHVPDQPGLSIVTHEVHGLGGLGSRRHARYQYKRTPKGFHLFTLAIPRTPPRNGII